MRQKNGIVSGEEVKDIPTCGRCSHINSYGAGICSACGFPLNIKAGRELKEKLEKKQADYDKLLKLANLIESSPEIMQILESDKWQSKAAEKMKAGNA